MSKPHDHPTCNYIRLDRGVLFGGHSNGDMEIVMSIHQLNLEGKDKVEVAVDDLREMEPPGGYYLAFSGGKDSIVIKALANMASVKYDAHYNVTTIDPPDLVWFIKKYHKDVKFDLPEKPFLTMLVKKGFPFRQRRWCCEKYKERGGTERVVMTGIRREESSKRSKRKITEECYKTNKVFMHPIINWSGNEVWEFIREKKLAYCKLYDEGWERIGCLFCPFATNKERAREARQYPIYEQMFRKAFILLYTQKKNDGKISVDRWASGDEMFEWWLYNKDKEEELPLFS